jgi:hypothetical protein
MADPDVPPLEYPRYPFMLTVDSDLLITVIEDEITDHDDGT